jgi:hypothetical protein
MISSQTIVPTLFVQRQSASRTLGPAWQHWLGLPTPSQNNISSRGAHFSRYTHCNRERERKWWRCAECRPHCQSRLDHAAEKSAGNIKGANVCNYIRQPACDGGRCTMQLGRSNQSSTSSHVKLEQASATFEKHLKRSGCKHKQRACVSIHRFRCSPNCCSHMHSVQRTRVRLGSRCVQFWCVGPSFRRSFFDFLVPIVSP